MKNQDPAPAENYIIQLGKRKWKKPKDYQPAKNQTTQPLKWKEALRLIKSLQFDNDFENLFLVSMGFYFGLRISDLLKLTFGQISQKHFEVIEKKTRKRRLVSIPKGFQKILFAYSDFLDHNNLPRPKANDFVLSSTLHNTNKPLHLNTANYRLKQTFKKYFVETANPSSHTLRKTFGLRFYKLNGKNDNALLHLSEIFNHSNSTVTRRYLGLTKKKLSKMTYNF